MITQPVPDALQSSSGYSERAADLLRNVDEQRDAIATVLLEVERIKQRGVALIDIDLGLSRETDCEGVHNLLATALHDLEQYLSNASIALVVFQDVSETLSASIQLHQVHQKNNRIKITRTAKDLRKQSQPLTGLGKVAPSDSFLIENAPSDSIATLGL